MGKLTALAMVLGLSLAHADPPITPQQKAKASELVKSAIAKSQAGDHDAAIELYQQAHMLIPQPLLLSNIGSEYKQQGKKVEAIKYFLPCCLYSEPIFDSSSGWGMSMCACWYSSIAAS